MADLQLTLKVWRQKSNSDKGKFEPIPGTHHLDLPKRLKRRHTSFKTLRIIF